MRRGLHTSKYNLLPELHYGLQIILKPYLYPKPHLTRQTSRRAGDVIELRIFYQFGVYQQTVAERL